MDSLVLSRRDEHGQGTAPRHYAPGDLIGGRYVVVGTLAESAESAVFACCVEASDQQVAVHALSRPTPERLRHLKAQFRELQANEHADLPRAFALHVAEGEAFVVMDWREDLDYGRVLSSSSLQHQAGPEAALRAPREGREIGGLRLPLVGRRDVLERLQAISRRACSERGRVVVLWGASGMGKTRLLEEFAQHWQERGDWVLAGRCYAREFVPFASLDGVADALRSRLSALPKAQLFGLQQEEFNVLARAFPALEGLVGGALQRSRAESERNVAKVGQALRGVLERLVRDRPIALVVDDAHWGDEDGMRVLARLWKSPPPPGLLLLVALRREGEVAEQLAGEVGAIPWAESVTLEPLSELACVELAQKAGLALDPRESRLLVELGGGNPNWVIQLARAGVRAEQPRSVEEAVRLRLAALTPGGRSLLQLLAAAGGPIPEAIARRALGGAFDFTTEADLLKRHGLVVAHRTSRGDTALDLDHDSTRGALLEGLSVEQAQELSGRLALAVENERRASTSPIAEYHLGAGQPARAVDSALVAAARAREQLAFGRAARLYDIALRHGCEEPLERARVLRHYGESLVAAGRGLPGAESLLEAARVHPEPSEQIKLRALAVESLFRCAEHERALQELPHLLEALGLSQQPWPPRLLAALLVLRTRLWLHRRRAVRAPKPVSADAHLRLELLWSLGVGLSLYDPLLAFTLQARHAVLAEQQGSPEHRSLSRATEAFILAWEGGEEKRRRGRRLMGAAEELARESDNPRVRAHLYVMSAGIAITEERQHEVLDWTAEGLTYCNSFCPQARWEMAQLASLRAASLLHAGRLPEMVSWVATTLDEADETDDRLARLLLRGGYGALGWLAAGLGTRLEQELASAELTPLRGYYRFQHLWAQAAVALAAGRAEEASRVAESAYRTCKADFLFRLRSVRIDAHDLRARCALTLAARRGDASHLKVAAHSASLLAREAGDWPAGLAAAHRGLMSLLEGHPEEACERLLEARNCLDRAGMRFQAHAVHARFAQLVGRPLDPPEDWRLWLDLGGAERLPALLDAVMAPLPAKLLG
jgi:hypothetical protein